MASDLLTRTGQTAAEVMGARISADTGEPDTFAWTQHLLGAPGYRLAGGTDQIQRNLIGERVLGLPGEPRTDRVPFSELPGS
jgi:alkylation response protein AidB-like acyl-CoA dehydrogenase